MWPKISLFRSIYPLSHDTCTWLWCALLCGGYIISKESISLSYSYRLSLFTDSHIPFIWPPNMGRSHWFENKWNWLMLVSSKIPSLLIYSRSEYFCGRREVSYVFKYILVLSIIETQFAFFTTTFNPLSCIYQKFHVDDGSVKMPRRVVVNNKFYIWLQNSLLDILNAICDKQRHNMRKNVLIVINITQ